MKVLPVITLKVEVQLRNVGDGSRIRDRRKMVSELFRIIQEQGPIRKTDIVKQYSALVKSFRHWINILDEYQVIEIEKHHNHQLYKSVSNSVLRVKEIEVKLIKGDGDHYQLV